MEKQHLGKPPVICRNNLRSFFMAGAEGKRGPSLATKDNLVPMVP